MAFPQLKTKSAAPTQRFLEIREIRDGVVVLKNGGLRAVLIASSINFELKGSEEQEAIIGYFQRFLNSLDFPLQILISSRKLNIEPYLGELEQLSRVQENELLHTQTIEYMDFVKKFVELTDIMNKSFYIIVPYNPGGSVKKGLIEKVKSIIKSEEKSSLTILPEKFQEYKEQLVQRVTHVLNGLIQLEIKTVALNTEQLIRLFYEFYNPAARK